MPEESPLIKSLRAAVDAAPDDVPLRLHLAQLLLEAGHGQDAISQVAAALQREPGNAEAQALIARAVAPPVTAPATAPVAPAPAPAPAEPPRYDWKQAEDELSDVIPPRFVESSEAEPEPDQQPQPLSADGEDDPAGVSAWDVETAGLSLADVGGMEQVKERLQAAFLAPMRNPELRKLYGKSLRGGLLMYGPPGCGKTYIARAVAGELGARFMTVSITDVLDMWIGNSERNLRELFETARRNAPCVVFLDELDALGAKRSQIRHSGLRTTVNQLLTELDGVDAQANEGLFVLAATNHPWDVDPALRRPGRLDRTVLVLPPDEAARESILRHHLKDRPVARIDLRKLVKRTDGFSGADLRHLCESAAERALMDSVRTGRPRMIETDDLLAALAQLRPSTGPWFDSARSVAQFANEGGQYDELLAYLKKKRML
ncbi:ATP-binding protein [Streptomyces hiroshimensis]|uniref:Cell division control protein 48 CDC48 n=1 Tax=Streptomyces hiroshimensis TaxID=66424 RepID=A0ABQ2Y904_9ACTN|nr:ATP-binding protein [Streptomyces hiroshimensis]GGX70904.1 cell division control protein 48 CDC48 [Streptomyces hiroshimensis]